MTGALHEARRWAAVAVLTLGPTAAQTAAAQTAALPPVEWEHIGLPDTTTPFRFARTIALKHGVETNGSTDTLYAAFNSRDDLSRIALSEIGLPAMPPASAPWTVDLHISPSYLTVTSHSTLLAADRAGPIRIDRSTDGGLTWTDDVSGDRHATCVYERPSGAGLVACGRDESDPTRDTQWVALGSTDDGTSWTVLGRFVAGADDDGVGTGSEANAITELAHAALGGTPRLVAGVYNGIAFSDDDGTTWQRSALWDPFRWFVNGFVQAAPSSAAALGTASAAQALGDTLFASGRDFATGHPVVLVSTDGVAWTVRHEFDVFADPTLAIGPEGALWVGTSIGATDRFPTVLSRSGDGGRTWTPEQSGYDDQNVSMLIAGRDGRMYMGGGGGVWRTKTRLFVAAAADLKSTGSATLVVRPNPSSGRVSVSLALVTPARVRLSVFDALGREVAVLADGPLDAGTTTLALDGAVLPAGIYVARSAANGWAMSQAFTVVR